MRHRHDRRLKGLAVILAVILAAAALPWARAQTVAPVIPGVSLADIPIGMRIGEVVARLGAPSEVRLVGTDGTLAYVFGQYGITTYTRAKVIVAISTTNSLLGSARGVGLLAPELAVRTAYGAPRSTGVVEGYPGLVYDGIAFGLDRHTVAVVMIFPSTSSAAPSSSPSDPAAPPTVPPAAPSSAPAVSSQAAPDTPTRSADIAPAASASLSPAPPVVATAEKRQGAAPSTLVPASSPSPDASAAPEAPSPEATSSSASASGDASSSTVDPTVLTLARMLMSAGPAAGPDKAGTTSLRHARPFTSDTRYLSLFGYIRYLVFEITRQWIGGGA